VNLKDKLLIQN